MRERLRFDWIINSIFVPLASVAAGFVVAGIVVAATGADPLAAFTALFQGAFTNRNALPETLVSTVPYVFLGLGVALGFRAGLFNIGAEGQFYIGALSGVFIAYSIHGLPSIVEIPLAMLAGMAGGFAWSAIAGFLKARFGAHEVITTIMLNYVAFFTLAYLLSVKGFQAPPYGQAISNPVDGNVQLWPLFGSTMRVHAGLLLALAAAAVVWWLLKYSTLGFKLRAVGANPFAARTAGMGVENSYVTVMFIAGALCGLAGVSQILGTNTQMTGDIDAGIGFDAITVALLGRANPVGIVFAGLLFGALHAGGSTMQAYTPIDLVQVIQSLIVLFIAAPAVIRALYRIKATTGSSGAALAKGWNG